MNDNEENVVDFLSAPPSVGSIVTRLDRWRDDIEHITCVVEWKSGQKEVFFNEKPLTELAEDAMILNRKWNQILDEM